MSIVDRSPKHVRMQEEEEEEEENYDAISIDEPRKVTIQLPPDFESRSSRPSVAFGPRRGSIFERRESILRIGDLPGHKGNRIYNFTMDFIIFLLMLVEIGVVIYLAISHFLHQEDLMALAMLLPIILNFIGATYYLSDETERANLERITSRKWATDLLQFPVVGPIFTALKVLKFSAGCSSRPEHEYERIEASAIRMRQAGGFFSAAPESLVQLTVLLTMKPKQTFDGYMEIFAVCLLAISLAESNCYNTLTNYYKMFSRHEGHKWKLEGVKLWQKIILFIHALASIGSRLVSSACLKAAAIYIYGDQFSFPLVLAVCLFAEIAVRLCCFYVIRTFRFCLSSEEIPSSCYESINYSWRSTILDYGFQSKNLFVQVAFYIQNSISFGLWWLAVGEGMGEAWVRDELPLPLSLLFGGLMIISFLFLLAAIQLDLIKTKGFFHKFHHNDDDEEEDEKQSKK